MGAINTNPNLFTTLETEEYIKKTIFTKILTKIIDIGVVGALYAGCFVLPTRTILAKLQPTVDGSGHLQRMGAKIPIHKVTKYVKKYY